ncbi:MAG: hypothetical protein M3O46_10105 [Myxococcota bacterium]|nr:hypothetical protein [Myxococcota bacterium]
MDAAEPPRIVFEGAPQCADGDRAEELLRQALAPARAPGQGWVVTMRVTGATPSAVTAEGEISDASGNAHGHNALTGSAADCAGLARAMGAWALDFLEKRDEHPPPADSVNPSLRPLPQPPPAEPAVVRAPGGPPPSQDICQSHPSTPGCPAQIDRAVAQRDRVYRDGMPEPDYAMPALELGMGAFLMAGGGAGGYAGGTVFLVDEVAQGVFLRPSAALGNSLATDVSSIWAAGRLDTCVRLPGRYASRNGIQLDLCGGPDVGVSFIAAGTQPSTPATNQTLPYVALGPSVDLHGEAGNLAVTLRGVGGVNVARQSYVDVTGVQVDGSIWSWRLELDFSWALHPLPK